MKKTTKLTLMSILTIALCVSLIVGATFALFTDQKDTDITVTSGNVSIDADVSFTSAWSAKWEDTAYGKDFKEPTGNSATFTAGGTATYANGELVLDRIVSGDGVKLTINLTNKSNVLIKYRVQIAVEDGGLMDGLTVSYLMNGEELKLEEAKTYMYSPWIETTDKAAEGGTSLGSLDVTIELPMDGSSDYQDKSCSLSIAVYAIQINGHVTDAAKLKEKEVVLNSDLLTAVSNLDLGSKSLVLGSWTTYADAVGGDFDAGKVVAGNDNVHAFEVGDKVYVLVYGKLVADTDYDNVNTDCLFYMFDFEHVDLSDVDFSTLTSTSLGYMFENSRLKSVNFAGADLSMLTSVDFLFARCGQLEEVDFSNADLSNVVGGEATASNRYMFHGCTSLKKVDFSGADLSKLEKISSMFYSGFRITPTLSEGNSSYESGDATPGYACPNLEEVSFANATFKAMSGSSADIFKGATNLKHVDFSNCDLHALTSISWFGASSAASVMTPAIETVDFSGADLSGVTSFSSLLRHCKNLKTVDFSGANLAKMSSMTYAFQNCSLLETLDFSNAQLANSTISISYFCQSCTNLNTVNFGEAFAKNAADEKIHASFSSETFAFSGCKSMEVINFAGCDFAGNIMGALSDSQLNIKSLTFTNSKLTGVVNLNNFYNSEKLESVDFSGADLGSVTSIASWFKSCKALKSVDFSGANLSSVAKWATTAAPFQDCISLETVDFTGATLASLVDTTNMFSGCTKLETVYLWKDFANVTSAGNMFTNCSSLVNIYVDAEMPDVTITTSNTNMFTGCTSLPGFTDAKSTHAHTGEGGYFQINPKSEQN